MAFAVRYPNYESLASLAGEDIMGRDTLDTNNAGIYFAGKIPGQKYLIKYRLNFELHRYFDQKLVQHLGDFSDRKRLDGVGCIWGSYTRYFDERWNMTRSGKKSLETSAGIKLSLRSRISNQNHYDADQLTFIDDYYDYTDFSANPYITFRILPADLAFQLSYKVDYRRYTDRPTQEDETGIYTDKKFYQWTHYTDLTCSYPLKKFIPGLSLETSVDLYVSDSNMKYEQTYCYNYTSVSYRFGAVYEF